MESPRPDEEGFGEAGLGEAQSTNPPDDDEMIEPDADPLDTDVEDADLFLGEEDEDIGDDEDLGELGEDEDL
ncbi:MAG: hypothetical protein ACXWGV_06455 [Solirubrobacterales bacterium]